MCEVFNVCGSVCGINQEESHKKNTHNKINNFKHQYNTIETHTRPILHQSLHY